MAINELALNRGSTLFTPKVYSVRVIETSWGSDNKKMKGG
jgi:hypothetical protein